MRHFSRALLLVLGLAACIGLPAASIAEELPLEKISSGTWAVEYAGQHFKVASQVPVKLRFEYLSPTQIKLTITSEHVGGGKVTVYWEEFEKFVYQGPVPTSAEPFEGILNTEGGFVDR